MPRKKKQDYYKTLGVARDATADEIKKAARRLNRELHTDVNPAPEATRRIKDINHAYSVLSRPEQRKAYDDELRAEETKQEQKRAAQPQAPGMHQDFTTGKTGRNTSPHRTAPPIPPEDDYIDVDVHDTDDEYLDDYDEATPAYRDPTPPGTLRAWVGALLPVVASLSLTVFVFASETIFQSDFVQHPPGGLLHPVVILLGLISGFVAIIRVPLGLFMVMVTLGFVFIGARQLDQD